MIRVGALALALLVSGCAASLPAVQGYEDTLRERIHRAKHLGAMQCAPVDLALAQSSYRFAVHEVGTGDLARAFEHLEVGLIAVDRAILQGPACPVRGVPVRDPAADPGPDGDGDAVADATDRCPYIVEDLDGYADVDGCPEIDDDGDGVGDGADRCPQEAEDLDLFQDDDGCPDADNDGDGFFDADDSCPQDVETVNGVDDDDGCPDFAPQHTTIAGDRIQLKAPLEFAEGTAILLGTAHAALRELAVVVGMNPDWRLLIEGHTDNRGQADTLKGLSGQRARAVVDFLIANGVAPDRLRSDGIGGANPLTTNRTEEGRRANNRIEFFIVQAGQ